MNTARKLLEGSKNIDLMKRETARLVQMIIGYALSCNKNWGEFNEVTPARGKYVWKIDVSGKGNITFRCFHGTGEFNWVVYFSQDSDYKQIRTEYAQGIYKSLDSLVHLVIKTFPGIDLKWKPLIDASAAFPQSK